MRKVLQINVTANWGSTGKIAEGINTVAHNHGWDCYFAYRCLFTPSISKLIKVGTFFDRYIHYIGSYLFDAEGLLSYYNTKKLLNNIKSIKPDIVHIHNIHDHWLNYKLLFEFLNQTDIKVVWTFHDFWAVTGHCMHFASVGCERYQTGCYNCPMQKVFPKSLMDRSRKNYEIKKRLFSANKNLIVIPVSDWVGEQVRKSFLKDKEICVINNGIDTSVFKPTSLDVLNTLSYSEFLTRTDGKYVIMSVASQWKYDKGLNDYKAMAEMLEDDEIIVLVGVDDEVIADLPSKIIGIKRTTNVQELAALYTRADVVTIMSSAETFGLTVIEGYACGTPAVVYDNTAPPSLITAGTGIVAHDGDYIAAYSAIKTIKSHGKNYYSESCRKLSISEYDNTVCFIRYFKLYNSLIDD